LYSILANEFRGRRSGAELEPAEYDSYQQNAGQLAKDLLTKILTSPEWQDLPDDLKRDAIDDVMRKTRDVARARTIQEFPDLLLRIAKTKRRP
jgi:hypothetical protein